MTLKRLLVVFAGVASAVLLCGSGRTVLATTPQVVSGVTITPAVLTLELAAGSSQASTSFDLTNHYQAAVTVQFALEPDADKGARITARQLSGVVTLADNQLTLQPGQTRTQTLRLTDSTQLPPGSQALRLIATQQAEQVNGVGIASRVVLPVTLIKKAGAVTRYGLGQLERSGGIWTIPSHVAMQLHNTGNMVVVPHGNVTLSNPEGTIVAQGVINEASIALSPGRKMALEASLTRVGSALLPGPYTLTAYYGLGGGDATVHTNTTLWYVGWWHIALLVGLIVGGHFGLHYLRARARAQTKGTARRVIVVGGGS